MRVNGEIQPWRTKAVRRIALAYTPWAWKHRRLVVTYAIVVAVFWASKLTFDVLHRHVFSSILDVIMGGLWIRMELRNLRRWDVAHRDPADPAIDRW